MDVAQQLMSRVYELQKPMNSVIDRGDSHIQRFYHQKVVFITGGSGFLGKMLVEKLFRSCDIKRVYLLMRGKRDNHMEDRLSAILDDPLFDTVREKKPDFVDRIVPVEGDVAGLNLGIAPHEWQALTEQVEVMFHIAATTRFDEPLARATLVNVRGTREVLALAQQCHHLRAMVHVSTAFCQATAPRIGGVIKEVFYPSPIAPDALISLAETMDEGRINSITPGLLKDWPNTYSFTKAVAEEAVKVWGQSIPVAIIRPPVVLTTYCEPTPGWADKNCVYGPSGLLMGLGLGVIHASWNSDVNIAFSPGDLVTNATIAVGWETATNPTTDPTIYTISSNKCGYSWGKASSIFRDPSTKKYASPRSVWYGWSIETGSRFLYWLLTWLLHYIPAYILDFGVAVVCRTRPKHLPPSFVALYEKYYKMSLVFGYFLNNEWWMSDENTSRLFTSMSSRDQLIFNFDLTLVEWDRYMVVWGLGLRKYIIRDGLEGSELGHKKQQWFKLANYLFFFLYFYLLFKIFTLITGILTYLFVSIF